MKNQALELETMASPRTWVIAVGFGLMLCHSATFSLTALQLPVPQTAGIEPRYFTIASLLVEIATFIALAVMSWRYPTGLPHKKPALIVSMFCCALFTAVQCGVLIKGGWDAPLASGILRCIVRGICPAIIWIAWFETLAKHDFRRVLVSYIIATIFSAGLTLLTSSMPPMVLAVTSGLTLVGSVGVLIVLDRMIQIEGHSQDSLPIETKGWTFPTVPVLLMAVFTFSNVFARNTLNLGNRGVADAGVVAVMSMLLLSLAFRKTKFEAWNLCGIALPLTLFGLFLLAAPDGTLGLLAINCIHAGDAVFAVFIGVVLCDISYRWGVGAAMLFGCAKAASALASLCGGLAFTYASGLDDVMFTLVLAFVGTGLASCYVLLGRSANREEIWGVSAEEAASTDPRASAGEEVIWNACARLAYQYGLTRREEQVLCLLARGLTAAQIEEELSVSNSTVKTHTNAVFRKMGIHSRKELAEVVAQVTGQ